MDLSLRPRLVGWTLGVSTVALTLAGAAGQVLKFRFGHDFVLGFVPLFDLSAEASVPTWYASATLLLCAALLAAHARVSRIERDGDAKNWAVLALIFLLLSIDETATIHETVGDVIGARLVGQGWGVLHYQWVLPGAAFALAVAVSYLRFLGRLPARTRWYIVLAGAIYVGGALGMEMYNAEIDSLYGTANLTQQLGTVVEEFLEMAGVALFAHGLTMHLAARVRRITLSWRDDARPRPAADRRPPFSLTA